MKKLHSLEEIEKFTRPHFIWERGESSNWLNPHSKDAFYHRRMGVSCFVGVCLMMGYRLEEVKEYLDMENWEVAEVWEVYQKNMREFTKRLAATAPGDKPHMGKREDICVVMQRRSQMIVNALRLDAMVKSGKQYIPINYFNI